MNSNFTLALEETVIVQHSLQSSTTGREHFRVISERMTAGVGQVQSEGERRTQQFNLSASLRVWLCFYL